MPENPLLPNARLKELYALMQRCHSLDTKSRIAREAMLAAAAIHLQPGDLLSATPNDTAAAALAPPPRANASSSLNPSSLIPEQDLRVPRLALCAAIARGLQAAANGGLVLTFANAGTSEPGWRDALAYAQHSQSPLLLVCADTTSRITAPSPAAKSIALTWASISKAAATLKLPIFPVDGEDAVAMYRVLQECSARARTGEGPAVIWCLLAPNRATLPRSAQPLARMKSYLAARNLLPAKAPQKN